MNAFSKPLVTNALLLVIAICAVIHVATVCTRQTHQSAYATHRPHAKASPSMSKKEKPLQSMGTVPRSTTTSSSIQHPPTADQPDGFKVGGAKVTDNFDMSNMLNRSLKCPSDAQISLADFSCRGDKASDIRRFVKSLHEGAYKQLPIPGKFDKVIEKYGKSALTQQALDIFEASRAKKRMMKQPQP